VLECRLSESRYVLGSCEYNVVGAGVIAFVENIYLRMVHWMKLFETQGLFLE
jgi:hypothetical protein